MTPWDDSKTPERPPAYSIKERLSPRTRLILAFIVLCLCTVGILYTGPGFNFALQVVLTFILLVFLFWLIT